MRLMWHNFQLFFYNTYINKITIKTNITYITDEFELAMDSCFTVERFLDSVPLFSCSNLGDFLKLNIITYNNIIISI